MTSEVSTSFIALHLTRSAASNGLSRVSEALGAPAAAAISTPWSFGTAGLPPCGFFNQRIPAIQPRLALYDPHISKKDTTYISVATAEGRKARLGNTRRYPLRIDERIPHLRRK